MKKKQIPGKLTILVLLVTIIPLIITNKSQTQTLVVEKSPILVLNEYPTRAISLNTSFYSLTPQLITIPIRRYSVPIIVAQISVGTIATIILIGGVILIAVIIAVTIGAKLYIWIDNNEIGIVNKKFTINPSLRLPPGRIIALNGEPGIQAKPLYPGIHWGYGSWMYTITKVPVIEIGIEEIGLVEAKDGEPLKPGQTFGEVVECKDFQNIQAFFDNKGQKGKQRAILTTGTYRINTEMFSIRKASVTKIQPDEIGLVEAKDGLPLKLGRNFGTRVNCKYFQDTQAFFAQGGNVGKQIDILPPNTYQINTDLFQVRKVSITNIGSEEIGLVEAKDGASPKPGESFGKVVDCDNFQDGNEFLRKGGQKGKQRAILTAGNYRINTDLFSIRKVPITEIATDEIGLVEATDGKPITQGQSFAKIVECNCFQDAQAFFDRGGQAGKQLAILRTGKYYINTDIFKIRKISAIEIFSGEFGLVEAKYGEPLLSGKNFAKTVECSDFQDAKAFLENGGQAGKQLAVLREGKYYINTELFNIRKFPRIRIPKGEIGLVVANDGAAMSSEQILGRVVECNSFQNAQAFLQNGGQKGKQLAILTSGDYDINTDIFTVITTANAQKYGENPEKLKVYKIKSERIGIVTTKIGKTLPQEEIAGSKIEGHYNYQDGQKFIDLGGYKGLQEEVLLEGEWNFNPWFVEVEQVPITKIEHEEVGVVISAIGKKYHKENDNKNTSLDKSESLYQLVDSGYKGVENIPLTAGQYAINTRVKTVKLVPTTQIILNWSDETKDPLNYDAKLSTLKLTSYDGYEFKVQFTQIIRIAPENAPKMICLIGSQSSEDPTSTVKNNLNSNSSGTVKRYQAIRNLVTRVLTKVVSGHFQQAATGKTAMEFQDDKNGCEKEARDYINNVLEEIGVEGRGTYIEKIDLPEHLDKFRQEGAEAQLEHDLVQKQQVTEIARRKLLEEQTRTQAQAQFIDAQARFEIEQMDIQINLERETAKAKADQQHLETRRQEKEIETSNQERIIQMQIKAFRDRVEVLSPAFYAHIESQGKWAEAFGQIQITYPQIMMGGDNSSGNPLSNTFQLLQLEHLDAFRNRLNLGTPIQQLPIQQPTGVFPASNQQISLPTESIQPRIPVVLLLDTSISMSGERINHLNAGITTFKREFEPNSNVSQCVELAIIACNSNGRRVQEFVNMDKFVPSPLKAEGITTVGKGIELALNEIQSYQRNYDKKKIQHRKPWLFLIIGSSPTDDLQNAAQRVKNLVEANQLNFFVVGVQGADMISLRQVTPSNTKPLMLDGLKFRELFYWLADYLKKVSSSQAGTPIQPLPITDWAQKDESY
ncbi:VWA domain-containing protein [Iningainema tapete]|uniref:VWA domain-containing protein n=1 Tax=Iningainema tapete BLCC-T55 TaxID=2748662 RepID=A0A8J7CF42_9CYAN|nr:VWA domain-containing protein [Iningainema tapete]MBD2774300.1 VWA domain-containing protein [Iningainema tapete BLCC-T55]